MVVAGTFPDTEDQIMLTIDRQADRLATFAVAQQRALCAGTPHRAVRLGRLVARAARLYAMAVAASATAPATAPDWLRRQAL